MNENINNNVRSLNLAADSSRFLVFQLKQELYAVPLLKVREVIAPTEITPVPHTPAHFKGVMNLRGQVISVLDMRLKFKMKIDAEQNPETAIIILDFSSFSMGVIVDTVQSVVGLGAGQISPSPDIESAIGSDYITGIARIDNKLILILDIEKALNVEEIVAIRQSSSAKRAS